MKEYNIQLYKMKFEGCEDTTPYGYYYDWKKFNHRYFYKKFKSLSDMAKYIVDTKIFMSSQGEHIYAQLSKTERRILTSKIWAIYGSRHKNKK